MSSKDSGYTLRSRKHKMVPFVSSSTKPIVKQDSLDSGSPSLQSQNNELDSSRIMSDNQDGLLKHVTVLDENLANGAATYIPLQDPGGHKQNKEGGLYNIIITESESHR